jgi:hypothetical protein
MRRIRFGFQAGGRGGQDDGAHHRACRDHQPFGGAPSPPRRASAATRVMLATTRSDPQRG